MSKGVFLFAQNNHTIDYVKQAIFCAKKIKKHLKVEVALATDNVEYLKKTYPYYSKYIDHVIPLEWQECHQTRLYFDGAMSKRGLEWRNFDRCKVYDLTPFDETLVIDTDFIIGNSVLGNVFKSQEEFLICKDVKDLNFDRPGKEMFDYISDRSIDMYWATVFYFKKTERMKIFFDLVSHIKENWKYYRLIYQIPQVKYRNDFSFSIAIHLLNGRQRSTWPKQVPGNIWLTTDLDILEKMDDEKYVFLLEKKNWVGHYTLNSIENANIHIMNKFSLDRAITEVLENE